MWSKKLYDNIVAKVSAIDISGFVLIIQNNTDKLGIEKKLMMLIRKYLILMNLLKKLILMQKLVKYNMKYLVLQV